jgi:hypothetical protein
MQIITSCDVCCIQAAVARDAWSENISWPLLRAASGKQIADSTKCLMASPPPPPPSRSPDRKLRTWCWSCQRRYNAAAHLAHRADRQLLWSLSFPYCEWLIIANLPLWRVRRSKRHMHGGIRHHMFRSVLHTCPTQHTRFKHTTRYTHLLRTPHTHLTLSHTPNMYTRTRTQTHTTHLQHGPQWT